ncbi:hypothetical protein [Erwinia sp. JH02]|uniref:hypothetical protein n=1 Tax=Erwinia sp. JH02 TaxID=2733394 RepID=UPI001489E151|nr:hypothetical protein [Erwinia sp. JH02]NNS09994.1 hypothetical protein [Erwinia sp. JH02]
MQNLTSRQTPVCAALSGVCLLVLDNDEQALFINGDYISEQAETPALFDVARLTASAMGLPLKRLELPVPAGEWCWSDITGRLNSAAGTLDARARVTVLECALGSGRGFHFCGHPVLSGSNSDLWFPRNEGESLHAAVERVMVMNHQARNVARMEPVSEHPHGADWSVVYNVTLNRG